MSTLRDALAEAFRTTPVLPMVRQDGRAELDTPDHPEARMLAEVALRVVGELLDTLPMGAADRVVEDLDGDTGPLEQDAEELARWVQWAAAVVAGEADFRDLR